MAECQGPCQVKLGFNENTVKNACKSNHWFSPFYKSLQTYNIHKGAPMNELSGELSNNLSVWMIFHTQNTNKGVYLCALWYAHKQSTYMGSHLNVWGLIWMCLYMSGEGTLLTEWFVTQGTSIGTLTNINSHMYSQIIVTFENFPTS